MGFGDAIRSCFSKYVTFAGRAARSEYWYFVLFTVLVSIPAAIVDGILFPDMKGNGPVEGLLSLALLLPSLAVTVRRLHDTEHSGFLLLWFYVVAIAGVAAIAVGYLTTGAAGTSPNMMVGVIAGVAVLAILGYGIWLFILMVTRGTAGANKYGDDPLAAQPH